MFGKKSTPESSSDPRHLGDGLYLRLEDDNVSLVRAIGMPYKPYPIKSIKVVSAEEVPGAVVELKVLAETLLSYRRAFWGAL